MNLITAVPNPLHLGPVLLRTFEALEIGVALCAFHGRVLYANDALRNLLRSTPDPHRIQAAVRKVLAALAARENEDSPRYADAAPVKRATSLQFDSGHAVYHLRAAEIECDELAPGAEAVVLIGRFDAPDNPDTLRRYSLTDREQIVARLIAQGSSNAEIATRLHISAHTARHHTEGVMRKMGVRSRSQVAALMLGYTAAPGRGELAMER